MVRSLLGIFISKSFLFGSPKLTSRSTYKDLFRCASCVAAHLFDEMAQRITFVHRALNRVKNPLVDRGSLASVHCLALKSSALSDLAARTSLLTAYARAEDLDSSLALFDEAAHRDVILWNAIINAFVLNRHFRTSITLFQEMVDFHGGFDSTTLVIVLSALSHMSDLKCGTVIHGTVIKRNFNLDVYLSNALIDMYAKCGDFRSSEDVFEGMEARDVTSWNSVITGSLYSCFPCKSLLYFREMRCSSVQVDEVSLSGVVSACSLMGEHSGFGASVHGLVIKLGYDSLPSSSVANSLISFFSHIGDVEAARMIFKTLLYKNVVSWNSMLSGLVKNGNFNEALSHFHEMQTEFRIQPNSATLISVIGACSELNLHCQGKSVHGFAIRWDLLDSSVGNTLLDMYLKCSNGTSAHLLFTNMPNKDLISWNTMISGFSHGDSLKEEARVLFCQLLRNSLRCSLVTLLAILSSCCCPKDLRFGKAVHGWKIRYGFVNVVPAVNALMLMYINCGDLIASSLLLETILPASDIISWNTILMGYVHNGCYKDALDAFEFLRLSLLLKPDCITLVSALASCGHLMLLSRGQYMHCLALKSLIYFDLQVKNALITMYFRCGDCKSAELLFILDNCKNLCSWNCMISGFLHNKEALRSLELFRKIENFSPNEFSIVAVLCACTQLGYLRHGKEINGYVLRFDLQSNTFVSSALVDMYSKCGRLDIAVRIFESTKEKSIASWNSMIAAYGFHGHGREAIELFWKMYDLGEKATKSTFISLLSACSHSGLVDEGWKHYHLMSDKFGIKPYVEHHVCMVDMLGRAGLLREAYDFIKKMSMKLEPGVLGALLSACHDHSNLKMGKTVGEMLFCSDPVNTGYYITLSNLFSFSGMWSDAVKIRSLIQDRGLMKVPGHSVIDVVSG